MSEGATEKVQATLDTKEIKFKDALIDNGKKFIAFVFKKKPTEADLDEKVNDMLKNEPENSLVSIQELIGSDKFTIKDIEVTSDNIGAFEPFAIKYGMQYSLKEITPKGRDEDGNKTPSTYAVFFRAKDDDVFKYALKDYLERDAQKRERRQNRADKRQDIIKKVKDFKAKIDKMAKNNHTKKKNRSR
jgi:hypothetical protein